MNIHHMPFERDETCRNYVFGRILRPYVFLGRGFVALK